MAPLNQSDGFALARAKQLLFGGTVTIPRLPLIKHQTVAVYTSSTTPVLIVSDESQLLASPCWGSVMGWGWVSEIWYSFHEYATHFASTCISSQRH